MERREKRRNKAQPWIVLKMPIGLTFGLVGYASYVYIGRFCVPMLKNHNGALSGGLRIGRECHRFQHLTDHSSCHLQYLS